MIRQALAQIEIKDLVDGFSPDINDYVLNGTTYSKVDLETILDVSIYAFTIKVKPNIDNKVIINSITDGLKDLNFRIIFENNEHICASEEIIEYIYEDNEPKFIYIYGDIGFILEQGTLLDITQFGDENNFVSISNLFAGYTNNSISAIDIPNTEFCTSFRQLFKGSSLTLDINTWNTSNILDTSEMYMGAINPYIHFVNIDLSKVTNSELMFANINSPIVLENINFTSLINSTRMFYESTIEGIINNVTIGDINNQTGMVNELFKYCNNSCNMTNIKIYKDDLTSMFESSIINTTLNLDEWIFPNEFVSFSNMFLNCNINGDLIFTNRILKDNSSIYQFINGLNCSNAILNNIDLGYNTTTTYMFNNNNINKIDITSWNFRNCSINGLFMLNDPSEYREYIIDNINISEVTDFTNLFKNNSKLASKNLKELNTSNAIIVDGMYSGCVDMLFDNITFNDINFNKVESAVEMFKDCNLFNPDLSLLKMNALIDTTRMFLNCSNFNQPLNNLDANNVEIMEETFKGCVLFNNSQFTSQKVKNIIGTFEDCSSFNNILNFDLNIEDNVEISASRFLNNAKNYKQDITFNTLNIRDLDYAFSNCINLGSLSSLNTSNVISCVGTFKNCRDLNLDLTLWDVENLTTIHSIFLGTINSNININNWNLINVLDATQFCKESRNSDISVENIFNNPNKLENLNNAFQFSTLNKDIGSWNVEQVLYLNNTFEGSYFNYSLDNWNSISLKYMDYTFANNNKFNSSINGMNVNNVLNSRYTFSLNSVFNQDIKDLRFNSLLDASFMFYRASAYNNQTMINWLDDNINTNINNIGFSLGTGENIIEPNWP